jgi:hypothetical protein
MASSCSHPVQELEGAFMIAFEVAEDAVEWCLMLQELMMEVSEPSWALLHDLMEVGEPPSPFLHNTMELRCSFVLILKNVVEAIGS